MFDKKLTGVQLNLPHVRQKLITKLGQNRFWDTV